MIVYQLELKSKLRLMCEGETKKGPILGPYIISSSLILLKRQREISRRIELPELYPALNYQ